MQTVDGLANQALGEGFVHYGIPVGEQACRFRCFRSFPCSSGGVCNLREVTAELCDIRDATRFIVETIRFTAAVTRPTGPIRDVGCLQPRLQILIHVRNHGLNLL